MHLDICVILSCAICKPNRLSFLSLLVVINIIDITFSTQSSPRYHITTHSNYSEIITLLEHSTHANVYIRGTYLYNRKRRIHNGLCHNLFPDLIVEPKTNYDVSQIVKITRYYGVPISVRSGGHSYICTSIKTGEFILICEVLTRLR